jgi:hypothetical protein
LPGAAPGRCRSHAGRVRSPSFFMRW